MISVYLCLLHSLITSLTSAGLKTSMAHLVTKHALMVGPFENSEANG